MDRFLILKPFVYAKSRLFLYFFPNVICFPQTNEPINKAGERQGKNEPIVSVIMLVFP
jgi:hypothetical protein